MNLGMSRILVSGRVFVLTSTPTQKETIGRPQFSYGKKQGLSLKSERLKMIAGNGGNVKSILSLVESSFSFSYNVFHSYISLIIQNGVLCGNGLKLSKHQYFFTSSEEKAPADDKLDYVTNKQKFYNR